MRKLHTAIAFAVVAVIASASVTLAAGATSAPPAVSTAPATGVSNSGATLNGSVNPNGEQTSYAFQWGPTGGYGHETALTSAGSGSTTSSVSATLSNLSSGTTYHFRIIAMSPAGTSVGSDQTFTTGGTPPAPSTPPSASTGSAASLGASAATVTGTVNPGGQSSQYYFEYGTTSNYGIETAPQDAGSGTSDEAASASLSGLSPSTTYHYRLVAVNPGGTALGHDQTFTTTSAPAGSHVAFMGRMGFVSPGGWIGVEAGCFGGQTDCIGHITMSHNGTIVGQRDFAIAPETGGFQNIRLTPQGQQLLRQNSMFHLLAVSVTVTTSDGQKISQVMRLARWVWH